MAIMDDMMCTVKPKPIKAPIVIITVAIATTIGAVINVKLRKKTNRRIKIINPAAGAEIAI